MNAYEAHWLCSGNYRVADDGDRLDLDDHSGIQEIHSARDYLRLLADRIHVWFWFRQTQDALGRGALGLRILPLRHRSYSDSTHSMKWIDRVRLTPTMAALFST